MRFIESIIEDPVLTWFVGLSYSLGLEPNMVQGNPNVSKANP